VSEWNRVARETVLWLGWLRAFDFGIPGLDYCSPGDVSLDDRDELGGEA
jgi:hypothetical protein